MTYKSRVGISVGLFVWSIGAIIASICFSQNGLLWTAYVGPIFAFVVFILSVIIMPKAREVDSSSADEIESREVFIYQPSWNSEADDEEWDDDDEEEEEEERRCLKDEEEWRQEEDEEEFMMYYEGND